MLHAIERIIQSFFRKLEKKPKLAKEKSQTNKAIEAKNKAIQDCENKLETIMPGDFNLSNINEAIKLTEDVIECLKQLIESTQEDQQSYLKASNLFSEIYARLLQLEKDAGKLEDSYNIKKYGCYGFASQGALTSSPDLYSSLV